MRRVDRSGAVVPAALTKRNRSGKTETEAAIEFFQKMIADEQKAAKVRTKGKKKKDSFPFSAYKEKEVRDTLEALFFGKCAYCEARYQSVHPVDIEHWRPKAEVIIDQEGKKKRYGYYWLAADWDNLLPACIDCNRIRTHFDFLEGKEITIGKGNWFPLADGCTHAGCAEEISNEDPLLLNPCCDDPEQYLEFREEGIVRPCAHPIRQLKAKASIRFYALNRRGLVQERLERILLIKQKIQTIRDFADQLHQALLDGRRTDAIENSLRREMAELNAFQDPKQPFSTMARQLIEKFLREIFG